MRGRELLQILVVMGVEKHRRDGLDRQPALLGDDPYRFHRRPGPRIVGQRLTAHRHHGNDRSSPRCARGYRRPAPRPRPIQRGRPSPRGAGEHPASPGRLDPVPGCGHRCPSPVTGRRANGLRRSSRNAAGASGTGCDRSRPGWPPPCRRRDACVSRCSRAPSRWAAACRDSTTSSDSETGLPWWRFVSLASIGSYSPASSGSDSSESRRTARNGHASSPVSKLTGPRIPLAAAATRALNAAAPTATALAR